MKKLLLKAAALILGALFITSCADRPAKGKHVVFIGDSITDGNWGCVNGYKPTSAERSHTDFNHIYGHSYMMLIASDFQAKHPEADYQFSLILRAGGRRMCWTSIQTSFQSW